MAGLPLGRDRRPSAAARTKRQASGDISLGLLVAVAALTCSGVVLEPWPHLGPVPAVPRVSSQDLARDWHGLFALYVPLQRWAPERLSLSRRRSATMVGQVTVQARVCLAVPPPA